MRACPNQSALRGEDRVVVDAVKNGVVLPRWPTRRRVGARACLDHCRPRLGEGGGDPGAEGRGLL
eukprot:14798556-Alexandrium_andersonii.AAC.1